MTRSSPKLGKAPLAVGANCALPASSIVELIEARIEASPDTVALEHRDEVISYGQLHAHANAIAAALLELRIEPGEHIALWADRTPLIVAASLAIMRVRAAYVPLDPSYPADRVRRLINAAAPAALLYDGTSSSSPPPQPKGRQVDLAGLPPASHNPSVGPPRQEDAAYVVFTSGSTGAPKGVVVEHRSLLNYACWCAAQVGSAGSGAPLFASLGFDHAATCLWVPLIQGKRVVLSPGVWDHEPLFGERPDRFTFLKLTPSHARFFERLLEPDYATTTELMMFGGEALDPALVKQLAERLGGVRLVNHYGPTEATVGCCWHEFALPDLAGSAAIPIGTPVWNSRAYVVDDDLHPVRVGAPGELVMAGSCVARGYLDGGSDGFISESLVGGGADRAYRTGDIVEQLPDGPLVYVGRNDSQLKVGGYRIELEELRHHALGIPVVGEVAFDILRGDVDAVEAFVVPVNGGNPDESIATDLRQALGNVLPPQVVPQKVHVVDELVFNSHGKCDIEATRKLHQGGPR